MTRGGFPPALHLILVIYLVGLLRWRTLMCLRLEDLP